MMGDRIRYMIIKMEKSEDQARKILEDFWEEAYNKGLEDGRCEECKNIAWQIDRGM